MEPLIKILATGAALLLSALPAFASTPIVPVQLTEPAHCANLSEIPDIRHEPEQSAIVVRSTFWNKQSPVERLILTQIAGECGRTGDIKDGVVFVLSLKKVSWYEGDTYMEAD